MSNTATTRIAAIAILMSRIRLLLVVMMLLGTTTPTTRGVEAAATQQQSSKLPLHRSTRGRPLTRKIQSWIIHRRHQKHKLSNDQKRRSNYSSNNNDNNNPQQQQGSKLTFYTPTMERVARWFPSSSKLWDMEGGCRAMLQYDFNHGACVCVFFLEGRMEHKNGGSIITNG
jgi:hypothetical protein